MSHRQIAEATKLSTRVIEAVESGRFSVMPAGIYRRSIVKAVAAEVGLDPDQALADFAAAFPNELPPPDLPSVVEGVSSSPSRGRAFGVLAVAVPVIAALTYMAWPARPIPTTTPLAPLPSRPLTARSSEVQPVGGFASAVLSEPHTVTITLTISSRCQLRVLSDGREILRRMVDAGERVPIDLGDEIVLSGDNAAAVQFSINGRAGRQLGQPGETLSVRIGRDDYESFLARH